MPDISHIIKGSVLTRLKEISDVDDSIYNQDGFCQEILGYDEFGTLTTEQSNIQPFGFTCYQLDEVSNTWYAQAREYKPQIGRFLSEDLVKGFLHRPLTQNLYTYCSNKPLSNVDLDGNYEKPEHDELTYYAGKLLGLPPEVVCMLQAGNRSVDDLISSTNPFLPVPLGNQLPHFNRNNPGEIDSRLVFADRYFNQAIQNLENRNFSRELEIITSSLVPHYLGRGLHAIQDIHAHGQIDAGREFLHWGEGHLWHSLNTWFGIGTYRGNPDSFYYDWYGDCQVRLISVPDRRLNMRYLMEILDSVDYLMRFQEEARFSLKDILY